jgi:hypothetical protein
MHTNNILYPEQFGFRQGSSTENAAFKLTDSTLKSINQKMHAGGLFCDLVKTFDCVNHRNFASKVTLLQHSRNSSKLVQILSDRQETKKMK